MPRFTAENAVLARDIIARYPRPEVGPDPPPAPRAGAGRLRGRRRHGAHRRAASASPRPRCSAPARFYEMFKREPVGEYLVNVCTNIACMLLGARSSSSTLEGRLGIKPGSTTADGKFTVEDVECIAACTEAPCLQVNYRYFYKVTPDAADALLDDLRHDRRAHEVPKHGVLARTRQQIPAATRAGNAVPGLAEEPVWLRSAAAASEAGA